MPQDKLGVNRRRLLIAAAGGLGLSALPLRAAEEKMRHVCLYYGEALGGYGFPRGHPLGVDRQGAFFREAAREQIERFHTRAYVETVMHAERDGLEFLDNGDTPVFPGVYAAGAVVTGAALDGLAQVMRGHCHRTFQPIGGLHHARATAYSS